MQVRIMRNSKTGIRVDKYNVNIMYVYRCKFEHGLQRFRPQLRPVKYEQSRSGCEWTSTILHQR